MVIDFVMSFSEHAKKRLSERYKNLTVDDLLGLELEDAGSDIESILINTCKPKSRQSILNGYREVKLFKGTGVCVIVNKSNLEAITILPNMSEFTKLPNIELNDRIDTLKKKRGQASDMAYNKRRTWQSGQELHRIDKLLSVLNKESKSLRIAGTETRLELEYKLLRTFVRTEFGDEYMQKFFVVRDKEMALIN